MSGSSQHLRVQDFQASEEPGTSPTAPPVDLNQNGIPDHEEMQTCCSGSSDRRFGIFLVQILMSMALFALCLIKLGDENLDCEATQLYVSLLSLLTGVWIKEIRMGSAVN